MLVRLRSGIRAYGDDARAAVRVAPIEVGLGVVAAATLSLAMQLDAVEQWRRIGIAALIAYPLVFTATALAAGGALEAGRRWTVSGTAVGAATLYATSVFDSGVSAEVWRGLTVAVAALLVPALVPIRVRNESTAHREWFWLYNTRLALRIVTVYGFALALMIGLWLALVAIDNLFDVNIDSEVYAHIASALLVGLAPWAIAGGTRALVRSAAPAAAQAFIYARRVGLYLILPLIAVYVTILYAYAIRIGFAAELPRNLVSPLMLAAGALWLVAAVVLEPFQWGPGARGVQRVVRALPAIMLPLAAFGAWAIALRIQQYGWTEFRYARMIAVAALAILSAAGVARLARRGPPPLFAIPIVLIILLLGATLGPLSMPSVVKRSQRGILSEALREAGFVPLPVAIPDSAGATPRNVSAETYGRVRGSLAHLVEHFGPGALDGILTGDAAVLRHTADPAMRLGLVSGPVWNEQVNLHARLAPDAAVQLISAGTLHPIETGFNDTGSSLTANVGAFTFVLDSAAARLVVRTPDGLELGTSFDEFAGRVETVARTTSRDGATVGPNATRMSFLEAQLAGSDALIDLTDAAGARRGQLLIRSISMVRGPDPFRAREGVRMEQIEATHPWRISRMDALLILLRSDSAH